MDVALRRLATASIEELIGEIKQRVTVLIVTHNMQQAARVSDYTAYMYVGELMEFGKTEDLFIKPQRTRCSRTSTWKPKSSIRPRASTTWRTTSVSTSSPPV